MAHEDDLTSRLSMPPQLTSSDTCPDANNNRKTVGADRTSTSSAATLQGHDKLDKYSLRPRSTRRRKNTNTSPDPSTSANEEQNTAASKPSRTSKPKQKPEPLSKYRRRTANARERSRMKEINLAFETLRRVVPQLSEKQSKNTNEKLTKITTLRLAMKYITTLSATLNQSEDLYGDLDLFLESDGESLPLHSDFSSVASDQSLTSDFSMDFDGVEDSLNSMDLCLEPFSPCGLPHHISSYDPFLSGFS